MGWYSDSWESTFKVLNKLLDANAFSVTDDLLNCYLNGFETPAGEGEKIIENITLLQSGNEIFPSTKT